MRHKAARSEGRAFVGRHAVGFSENELCPEGRVRSQLTTHVDCTPKPHKLTHKRLVYAGGDVLPLYRSVLHALPRPSMAEAPPVLPIFGLNWGSLPTPTPAPAVRRVLPHAARIVQQRTPEPRCTCLVPLWCLLLTAVGH